MLLSRAQNWNEPIGIKLKVLLGGIKECIILLNRRMAFVVKGSLKSCHPFNWRQLEDSGDLLLLLFYLRETGFIPECFV